tara:strand:- start:17 stop:391 length:375 start_codon:yes stop_codon:yes gene_type:complete
VAITKILLSGGGTDGKPLQGSGSFQTIHTASSTATDLDEVWLWACNISATDALLKIGWGSSGQVGTQSILTISKQAGLYLVVPGLLLKGNAGTPKIVNVETATSGGSPAANAINMVGYVNRHSV